MQKRAEPQSAAVVATFARTLNESPSLSIGMGGRGLPGIIKPPVEAARTESTNPIPLPVGLSPFLPSTSADLRVLTLLIEFQDAPAPCGVAEVEQKAYGATNSMAALYREVSYGALNISGRAAGPYRVNARQTDTCANLEARFDEARLAAQPLIDAGQYHAIAYVMPPMFGCPPGNGTAAIPRDVPDSNNRVKVRTFYSTRCHAGTFAHELGHQLGFLTHGLGIGGVDQGDSSDIMSYDLRLVQLNAYHRDLIKWIDPNRVLLTSEARRYTIAPLERLPGETTLDQIVKVTPPGSSRTFYLSYRRPIDLDANIPAEHLGVHMEEAHQTAGGIASLLLARLSSNNQTYRDEVRGIQVTQISADPDKVVVDVSFPSISIDSIPPTLTVDPLPGGGTFLSNSFPPISGTYQDNVGVTELEYFVDGVAQPYTLQTPLPQPGTAVRFTYILNATVIPLGPHTLKVRIKDATNPSVWSPSIPFTVVSQLPPVDTIRPTVSWVTPTNGSTVTGTIPLRVSASDNVGVTRVAYRIDGAIYSSIPTAPFSSELDTLQLLPGIYVLSATAFDAANNSSTVATTQITVNHVPVDSIAPQTSLTAPIADSTLSGTVSLRADASDNVGVVRVELLLDGGVVGSTTSAPYAFSLDTRGYSNGAHTLRSRAFDAANLSALSAPVSVLFRNDLAPPVITHLSPASGVPIQGIVTVAVSASDDIGVARVEFRRNGALVTAVTSAPYSYSWDTRQVLNGTHSLQATAFDAFGRSASTPAVSVSVANPPAVVYVRITGQVFDPKGLPLTGAKIRLIDSQTGVTRDPALVPGSPHSFEFANVEAGRQYTVTVAHKKARFGAQVITPTQNVQLVFNGME